MRTLYRARAVYTQSYPATGEWILVDDRHVQRVGSGDPPAADRVVELPGATVIPGFVDTHVHLTPTGIALANVEVERAGDARELLALARTRAADGDGPLWLQGFDETRWTDPELPGVADLDAATARALAICRTDGHVSLANTAAIEGAGIADVPGTEHDEQGRLTGRVRMEANDRLHRWFAQALDDREIQELQLRAAGVAASRGITSIHEMSMPAGHGLPDLEILLEHRHHLPVDGSVGARTAAVTSPYVDGGLGAAYYEDEELERFFMSGHAAGLQVGVHAIGDRAIE